MKTEVLLIKGDIPSVAMEIPSNGEGTITNGCEQGRVLKTGQDL